MIRSGELSIPAPFEPAVQTLRATVQREPSRTLVVREVELSHRSRQDVLLRALSVYQK